MRANTPHKTTLQRFSSYVARMTPGTAWENLRLDRAAPARQREPGRHQVPGAELYPEARARDLK